MASEFRYLLTGDGEIRENQPRNGGVWRPEATVFLDGVRSATWLGPFGPAERDLLRIVSGALAADRLSPRRPPGSDRSQRNLRWQRLLGLRVQVESPDRWSAATSLLRKMLGFATDDTWEIEIEGIPKAAIPQQLRFFGISGDIREAALFSGGLDSVAGTFARGQGAPGELLAVSACGNDVRGAAQRAALQALSGLGIRVRWLNLHHQLRDASRPPSEVEPTQRSRGLLFLAMGAVAASELGLTTFGTFETGVGCINLPLSSAQVGAQATRAMHPRTLALFNDLVRLVLARPVRVVAPFFLHTKGELCRLSGQSLAALAGVAMSCDEGEGHKPDPMLHCGICTSCLFRRIALHAGGLVPDDVTRYRDTTTRQHGEYELKVLEAHGDTIRSCRAFEDLIDIDPDIRFARSLPFEEPTDSAFAETAVFSMFERYASEIRAFLQAARPVVIGRARLPKKERECDLFSAVG